jgi:hypothetical protein
MAVGRSRGRVANEAGFAVPTVLFMLLAAGAIAGVAVTSSVLAQQGATRDSDTKAALTVAEAGVSQALLHYNRVPTTAAAPCVVADGGTVRNTATIGGWCPWSLGEVNGANFAYSVKPTDGEIEIVSTGNADGVTRRIDVDAVSAGGQRLFSDASVKAQDFITMDSNAQVLAGMATNGGIGLSANARVCGSASVGLGRQLTVASNAQWYGDYNHPNCVGLMNPANVPQAPLTLPMVNQGDAATNNDNARLFSQDLISGSPSSVCFNGVRGNGSAGSCGTRHLSMSSNTSVTLSGDTYSFCRLTMSSNTNLYVAAGATVRIFFDSPEACGLSAGTAQLDLSSNSRITATGGGPANVAMLFVGSPTQATSIHLSSNTQVAGDCEQNFVIYAPRTAITMNSNSTYCGALAGKSIHLDSNAKVYTDLSSSQFELPAAAPHYNVSRFVECSSSSATGAPDAGC